MPAVFLSYRRTDADFALQIFNSVRGRWSRESIFWDSESIPAGAQWASALRTAVRDSKVVLLLIGPDWLTVTNDDGARRLEDPDDWVRQEVLEAFTAQRPVVPILAPRVEIPQKEAFPHALQSLAELQMLQMDDRRFATRLLATLEPHLGTPSETPLEDPDPLRTQRLTRLLRKQVNRLQLRAVKLLESRQRDDAVEEAEMATEVLLNLLDFEPANTLLLLHQGYVYKTLAQAYAQPDTSQQADRYAHLAQVLFQRIRDLGRKSGLSTEDRAGAVNGLGNIHHHFHNFPAAMRACREATEILPTYVYAWHDLLAVRLVLAEHESLIDMPAIHEALTQLETHAQVYPGEYVQGLRPADLADRRARVEDLARRIQDNQAASSAEDWAQYAFRSLQDGHAEIALAAAEESILLDNQHPGGYLLRGIIRIGDEELDEGLADLERCLQLNPNIELAYYNGACAWALKKDTEKALEWLENSLRLQPGRRLTAGKDPHFQDLQEIPKFCELVGN